MESWSVHQSSHLPQVAGHKGPMRASYPKVPQDMGHEVRIVAMVAAE